MRLCADRPCVDVFIDMAAPGNNNGSFVVWKDDLHNHYEMNRSLSKGHGEKSSLVDLGASDRRPRSKKRQDEIAGLKTRGSRL